MLNKPNSKSNLGHRYNEKQVIIFSVIVCYRPNIQQLRQLYEKLILDGSNVILIDNTETPYLNSEILPSGCHLITLGLNSGIAHAQNIGIDEAILKGGNIIIFFDQDSKIEQGLVRSLTSELNIGNPDIVAPRCVDNLNDSELPSLIVNRYGVSKTIYHFNSTEPYSVDIVISSGMAVTKDVFQIVGNFDEGLFIDFVDTEWCMRCRKKNIPIRIVPTAIMYHRIGMNTVKFGPLTLQVHNFDRCYYQIRNSFLLFRKQDIPLLFTLKEIISTIVNRMILLFFVKNRSLYVKNYLRAIIDGVLGVDGPKAF